ncbi:hypothetical protein, partial [Romboutsia sp.]|uniref:YkvI family membrane protein n=1 Tax=Romboutsia sp. TaxID=1965302 RepID=UPI002C9A19FB
MSNNQTVNWKDVISFGGAYVAFCIGSGFATGQEIMQFFTSFGYWSIGGAAITLVLFAWFGGVIMETGHRLQLTSANSVFKYYCGNTFGTFFEWFAPLFLFAVFVIMISGAGATLTEYYGLNPYVGRMLMAILALVTVLMGLDKLVKIIGTIGPIIIIVSILIGIFSIIKNPDGLKQSTEIMKTINVPRAANYWWLSGFLYAAYSVVGITPFLTGMGASAKSKKDAILGGALGGIAFIIALMIMNLGLLANIKEIYSKQIPSLYLADQVLPIIGVCFSIILFAGIYTTAVPMLWSVCNRFTKDGTREFKILAIALTVSAFIGGLLPFGKLVGIVYPYT